MNYDELQKLRDRLIEASQQRPRSRLQGILDRLLGRVEERLNSEDSGHSSAATESSQKRKAA
jgi:hypothetical protein